MTQRSLNASGTPWSAPRHCAPPRLVLEPAGRDEGAVGVHRDEGAEPAVEPRDPVEAVARDLDRGDLALPDRRRGRGQAREVGHAPRRSSGKDPGSRRAPLPPAAGAPSSRAAVKRAGSSARESSPASRSITPRSAASSACWNLFSLMAEAYYGNASTILDNTRPARVLSLRRSASGTASHAGWLPGLRKGNTMRRTQLGSWVVLGFAVLALTTAAPAQAQKKTLVVALNQDPDILDPTLSRTYVGPDHLRAHVREALRDRREPAASSRSSPPGMPAITDGGKTVTIKLRRGREVQRRHADDRGGGEVLARPAPRDEGLEPAQRARVGQRRRGGRSRSRCACG